MTIHENNYQLCLEEFSQRKTTLQSRPPLLSIPDMLGHCNASCLFCWQHNPSRNRKKNQLDMTLQPLPTKGKTVVDQELLPYSKFISDVNANEIFLEKNTIENILHPQLGRVFNVATNGSLFPKYVDRFIECSNEITFKISLNASTSELHKKITGLPNFQDIIIAAKKYAAAIHAKKLPVQFAASMVVMRSNIDDIVPFFMLCKDIGFQHIDFIMLISTHDYSIAESGREFSYYKEMPSWNYDHLMDKIREVELLSQKYSLRISFASAIDPPLDKKSLANLKKRIFILCGTSVYHIWTEFPRVGNHLYRLAYFLFTIYNDFRLLFLSREKMETTCDLPWKVASIERDGRFKICCAQIYNYGNVLKGNVHKRIWNGWRLRRMRHLISKGIFPGCCKSWKCPHRNQTTKKYIPPAEEMV